MVEYSEWMELTEEEQKKLLGWEKLNQLEPEHIEMGVSPRPRAEHANDDYMAQGL